MYDTDVFVIGGGPAGLAAAIAARRCDLRVTLADGQLPPIDKTCGEGLMPDSLQAAAGIGIVIPAEQGFPFRGIQFLSGQDRPEARFRTGRGIAIRRTTLHRSLMEQAEAAGAHLLWNTSVTGIEDNCVRTNSDRIRARWIIGADGERSRVRTWAGLDSPPRHVRYGFRRHYRLAPWTDVVQVYWGGQSEIYIAPVARDEVAVIVLSRNPKLRVEEGLDEFPELRYRLTGAPVSSVQRGAVSVTRRLPRVVRGPVALLGDASGSVDAVTGEGIGLAFRQASALAASLAADDLRLYQRQHHRINSRALKMGEMLLAMDRWPELRKRAVSVLAARPELFERLLALHVGELESFHAVAAQATLGWRLLVG